MQSPLLSVEAVLSALSLDIACLSLIEKTAEFPALIHASTPQGVCEAIIKIGQLLDQSESANQLAEDIQERVDIIAHKLKFIADEHRPKILCLHDSSPVVIAQNDYLDKLVHIAGGISYTRWQQQAFDPDAIILINDKPVSQLLSELPNILATSYWSETNAVKNNNIFVVHDGKALQQPSPRIAEDVELLAEIINPKYFIYGYNETSWMQFDLG